ncbi:MAG: hypothetical protein F4184_09895 [Gemmatimonadetes bacterium]|nr:hypothetical protein [Gemmatimonadota bacterium]
MSATDYADIMSAARRRVERLHPIRPARAVREPSWWSAPPRDKAEHSAGSLFILLPIAATTALFRYLIPVPIWLGLIAVAAAGIAGCAAFRVWHFCHRPNVTDAIDDPRA